MFEVYSKNGDVKLQIGGMLPDVCADIVFAFVKALESISENGIPQLSESVLEKVAENFGYGIIHKKSSPSSPVSENSCTVIKADYEKAQEVLRYTNNPTVAALIFLHAGEEYNKVLSKSTTDEIMNAVRYFRSNGEMTPQMEDIFRPTRTAACEAELKRRGVQV